VPVGSPSNWQNGQLFLRFERADQGAEHATNLVAFREELSGSILVKQGHALAYEHMCFEFLDRSLCDAKELNKLPVLSRP